MRYSAAAIVPVAQDVLIVCGLEYFFVVSEQ